MILPPSGLLVLEFYEGEDDFTGTHPVVSCSVHPATELIKTLEPSSGDSQWLSYGRVAGLNLIKLCLCLSPEEQQSPYLALKLSLLFRVIQVLHRSWLKTPTHPSLYGPRLSVVFTLLDRWSDTSPVNRVHRHGAFRTLHAAFVFTQCD